jgi:hypothetical protein
MADINEPQTPGPAPSAPEVPKELLSARPAMTKVVPRSPDNVEAASMATDEHADDPVETEEDRQKRVDFLKNLSQQRPKKKGKKWLVAVIVIIALAVLAGAGYWALLKPEGTSSKKQTGAEQAQTSNQPTTTEPQATTPQLKDYDSTSFPIVLKYPADWTVNDTSEKLTFTSPSMELVDNTGSKVNGAVVFTVQNKQSELPQFKKGSAVAVLASEHIKYESPAAGQRDSTYLSFLQYAGTTQAGSLDAMYVTGNAGYQKAQNVPEDDVIKVDPLITINFVACDSKCNDDNNPMTVSSTVWAGDLKATIEAMLQSLQIS